MPDHTGISISSVILSQLLSIFNSVRPNHFFCLEFRLSFRTVYFQNFLPTPRLASLAAFAISSRPFLLTLLLLLPFSPQPAKQGEKKDWGAWFMNAACRDSAAIGAGYEDELKSGKFKKARGAA